MPQYTEHLAIAPSAPLIAFACTSKDGGASREPGPHLFKTTDGGKTWQPQVAAPQPDMPCQMFINPADANDVILQQVLVGPIPTTEVVSSRYLWRTRDGGATWKQLTIIDNTFGFGALAFLGSRLVGSAGPARFGPGVGCPNPAAVAPAPFTRIYASDDGGVTWQPVGQSLVSQGLGVDGFSTMGTTLIAHASTPLAECVTTPPPGYQNGYWKSTNAGTTWVQISFPTSLALPVFTMARDGSGFYGVMNGGIRDPARPELGVMSYTANSGATWTTVPYYVPDGAPPDSLFPGVGFPLVTSTGTIVATFMSFGPHGLGTGKDIVTIRPSDLAPAWKVFAPNDRQYRFSSVGALATFLSVQGDVLWVVDGEVSWYLLLP